MSESVPSPKVMVQILKDNVLQQLQTIDKDDMKDNIVSLDKFKSVILQNRENGGDPIIKSFKDIVLFFPKKEEKKPSEYLQKRREYLKLRQEERDYNKMIYDSEKNPNVQDVLSKGNQFDTLRNHLSIGFNMYFSVFATAGMGYYLAVQLGFSSTHSLMISLVAAIIVLIMEMILFILRTVELQRSTEKPATLKDVKLAQFKSGGLITVQEDDIDGEEEFEEIDEIDEDDNEDIELKETIDAKK